MFNKKGLHKSRKTLERFDMEFNRHVVSVLAIAISLLFI